MICEKLGILEGYRYIIKYGKYGLFFYDTENDKQMSLNEVCVHLNEYYEAYVDENIIDDNSDTEMGFVRWTKRYPELTEMESAKEFIDSMEGIEKHLNKIAKVPEPTEDKKDIESLQSALRIDKDHSKLYNIANI